MASASPTTDRIAGEHRNRPGDRFTLLGAFKPAEATAASSGRRGRHHRSARGKGSPP